MRRRLFGKLTERVTLSYGKPVITYLAYGVVPVGGVAEGTPFLPSYRYYVPVTETVTKGTSTTSTTSNVEVTQDTDLSTLSFTPSLSFDITPDGRSDVDIVEDTGSLIVGSAEKIFGEGYYGVGTVHMTVTVEGTTSEAYDCYAEQAMNTVQVTTSYSIDITRFDYDTEPADGDVDLYPNLDFTVTETKKYSDGSPDETTVDSVSYRKGTRNSGGEWSPRFTRVSGDFDVDATTGRVAAISKTEETGEENIEIGEVCVDIDIASYTSASATTKVYQEMNEEPQEETSFPMDILMLNNETHKQEIMGSEDHTTKDFPKGTYTPIGIVLTPVYRGDELNGDGWSGENRYSGYGEDVGVMGVIALTDASLSNPETGTTNPSEILCGNSDSYYRMWSWTKKQASTSLPYIDINGTPTNEIQDAVDNFYIPVYDSNNISLATDKSNTVSSPIDAWSGYADANSHKAASPYFVSEKYKNKEYNGESGWDFEGYNEVAYDEYEDPYNHDTSALADYDGEFNSIAILTAKSWYGNSRTWIEDTTSNSNSNSRDCPAVEACWKYAPEGTATGGWYLPALGELSLMAARFEKINETLTLLNKSYGVSVSLLKDTDVPYLSSTHFYSDQDLYDKDTGECFSSELVFALFPDINGDMGVNRVCTTNINGATRYGGYVRPFKKIRNEIPYGNTFNAYNFTPHYELMPAHYTETFCDKNSKAEWFGQKFIVSFRRDCMGEVGSGRFSYVNGDTLRIYGYRVKGADDTTKVDETPRLLAETNVKDAVSESLGTSNAGHWPQVSDGQGGWKYEGDEMGINIVGRFTTTPMYDTAGAFDRDTKERLDMDTDEFDRDGTVEPGWYIFAGIGLTATTDVTTREEIITYGTHTIITKKEIDVVNDVESKEAFFDKIRHSTFSSLTEKEMIDAPFYVGQLDRPVAILLGSQDVNNDSD